jgi:hypothetical protein
LVERGRVDEAREFGVKLLQISPEFAIHEYLRIAPVRGEDYNVRAMTQALRVAGLPE